MTSSKTLRLSCKYLRSHVRTLAVVSWAANITPIMLSAICESLSLWSLLLILPLSSLLALNRAPNKPPPLCSFSLLFSISLFIVSVNCFLAFRFNSFKLTNFVKKEYTYVQNDKFVNGLVVNIIRSYYCKVCR